MKYDKTQRDCLACPIGYTSEQELSLNCTKCPKKKKHQKGGVENMLWVMALFLMLFFLFLHCLLVCLFLFLFPVLVKIVFP